MLYPTKQKYFGLKCWENLVKSISLVVHLLPQCIYVSNPYSSQFVLYAKYCKNVQIKEFRLARQIKDEKEEKSI